MGSEKDWLLPHLSSADRANNLHDEFDLPLPVTHAIRETIDAHVAEVEAACAELKLQMRKLSPCLAKSSRDGIVCESSYQHSGHHSSREGSIMWPDTERVPGDHMMDHIDKITRYGSELLTHLSDIQACKSKLRTEIEQLRTSQSHYHEALALAQSMIRSGEGETDISRSVFHEAFDGNIGLSKIDYGSHLCPNGNKMRPYIRMLCSMCPESVYG